MGITRRSRASKENWRKIREKKRPPESLVVKGSFHQGDSQFMSSAGKQCSCNALIAIAFLNMHNDITPTHINKVLLEGDKLYRIIRERLLQLGKLHVSEHLTTNNFPSQVFMDKVLHKFRHFNSLYGRLGVGTNKCVISDVKSLDFSLQQAFNLSNASILVIGNEMVAVFRNGKDQYGIFDSHSRDNDGMATENGQAVLLYFTSLQNLVRHLHLLAKSLSLEDSTILEIKPIAISSTMQGRAVDDISFTSEVFEDPSSQEQVPCSNTQTIPSLSQAHKPPKSSKGKDESKSTAAFEVPNRQAPPKGHELPKVLPLKGRKKKQHRAKMCECLPGNKDRSGRVIKCKKCKSLLKRARTLKRKMRLKIPNDPSVTGMSGDKLAPSQQKTLHHCKTKEESEALLLIRDVQKLAKYLRLVLQKINMGPRFPSDIRYQELSMFTAAELILFNKPRADAVMKLTVQSYNEQITKLNLNDETLHSLSSVEKKLCERLEVVKVPDNEGNLVPILLTPSSKATMATLVEMRSLVNIDSSNPYLFVKCESNQEGMTSSTDVLNTVSEKAGLLRNTRVPRHVVHTATRNTSLLNDVRLQNQVATISQLMSMQGHELNWLKFFIANLVVIDSNQLSNLQTSALDMAKVVQILHSIESGQAHQYSGKDWSQLKLSDFMVISDDTMQEPQVMDTVNGSIVTNDRHGFQETHCPDVSRNAGNSTTLEVQDCEGFWSIVGVPSNTGISESLGEDMESDDDIPFVTEGTDEPIEEKYADVLRRANTPIVTECTDETLEEKYADVLRRTSIPNKAEVESQDQKDDKSIFNISVDLSSV